MYKNKSSTGFNNICGQKLKNCVYNFRKKPLSANLQICFKYTGLM